MEWLRIWQCSQVGKDIRTQQLFQIGEKNWCFPQNVLYNYYINLTVPNAPTNWKNQKLHVLASCCIHFLPELPIWRQPSLQQHFIESRSSLAKCVSVLDWFTCSLKGRIPKIIGTFTILCWYCIVNLPNLWLDASYLRKFMSGESCEKAKGQANSRLDSWLERSM